MEEKRLNIMNKIDKWEAEHVNWSGAIHVFIGLGIAWLISLAWYYTLPVLIVGMVCLITGIAGLIYPLFAQQ